MFTATLSCSEAAGYFRMRQMIRCIALDCARKRVGVVGPKRCAVVKVCLVLSGESRPRWKKAGKTIR